MGVLQISGRMTTRGQHFCFQVMLSHDLQAHPRNSPATGIHSGIARGPRTPRSAQRKLHHHILCGWPRHTLSKAFEDLVSLSPSSSLRALQFQTKHQAQEIIWGSRGRGKMDTHTLSPLIPPELSTSSHLRTQRNGYPPAPKQGWPPTPRYGHKAGLPSPAQHKTSLKPFCSPILKTTFPDFSCRRKLENEGSSSSRWDTPSTRTDALPISGLLQRALWSACAAPLLPEKLAPPDGRQGLVLSRVQAIGPPCGSLHLSDLNQDSSICSRDCNTGQKATLAVWVIQITAPNSSVCAHSWVRKESLHLIQLVFCIKKQWRKTDKNALSFLDKALNETSQYIWFYLSSTAEANGEKKTSRKI